MVNQAQKTHFRNRLISWSSPLNNKSFYWQKDNLSPADILISEILLKKLARWRQISVCDHYSKIIKPASIARASSKLRRILKPLAFRMRR
jgi:adenine-specific DNA glycosylase